MISEPLLSVQLYSLREHGDLEAQLDLVKEAGFPAVETIERLMEDPARTRSLLDARGLVAPSGHVSLRTMREHPERAITAAGALGIRKLVVPAIPEADRPRDVEGWRAIGAELGRMAERVRDCGLELGFHNHAWEVAPLPDSTLPLDLLLDAGAEGGLAWQADLAWLIRGGDDPSARVERHRDRLASVHVKDIARPGEAADEDGWADVGHGTVAWNGLWARCLTAGATLMIAEHDKPNDGRRFLTRSGDAMRNLSRETRR